MRSIVLKSLGSISLWLITGAALAACPTLLAHTFNSLVGDKPVELCQYAGKTLLVVNTASQCGYTPQYAGLEQLYRKYRERGFVILGFPANDFGQQEPGSNADVARFCRENYGVSFPMFEKAAGDTPLRANPLYAKLIAATGQAPQWNFHKYLIDKSGRVTSFETTVEPQSREMVRAIEAALGG